MQTRASPHAARRCGSRAAVVGIDHSQSLQATHSAISMLPGVRKQKKRKEKNGPQDAGVKVKFEMLGSGVTSCTSQPTQHTSTSERVETAPHHCLSMLERSTAWVRLCGLEVGWRNGRSNGIRIRP